MVKRFVRCIALFAALSLAASVCLIAAEVPKVAIKDGAGQLIVNGQPFLILGGELGNSSAGTAAQADSILPRLATMHLNTVLVPVAWDQTEPREGQFDFSTLDHWIVTARQQHLHLVLLWFGTWKNAFSDYAPAWVKADPKRFPRALAPNGEPTQILSTLGAETLRGDSRAFATLLKHLRETDAQQQTVLMIQVENEVGYLGRGGRDRSPEANHLFEQPVPAPLLHSLEAHRDALSPELAHHFAARGANWQQVFGDAADEVFMAYQYATYIQTVASAGKREYPLPMYVNAQLPAPEERRGEYPSGGPHPNYLAVYRSAAPALDFFSPDIYWPDFANWLRRYELPGNAVFVPEARLDAAPYNALYAYGAARAFGFSAFSIDSLPTPPEESGSAPASLRETYAALDSLRDLLPAAQGKAETTGLVLHATSPRPSQTVALGGYLFSAALSRTWPARSLATDDGAMLMLKGAAPDEFYVIGSGLTVTMTRDPDVDNKTAGITSIEEVARQNGAWITLKRLNGDESNQGRQLLMNPHRVHIYRIRLYAFAPEAAAVPR